MSNLPKNFNYKSYLFLNIDLQHLNEMEAVYHYLIHGKLENRKYTLIPEDFNYQDYLFLNKDIQSTDEESALIHYETYGYYENRLYKLEKEVIVKEDNTHYEPLLPIFLEWFQLTLSAFQKDNKMQFRYECYKYIYYIKPISLPTILTQSDLESVLIEYRCLPHIEFIIRNNIIKLGNKWSHTVICGNVNYDYMVHLCNSISPNIKIIKTNYDNLMPSEYSRFLTTLEFWELLNGKKILIYQEDSLIFKNNIDDFLYFDYIGAPWQSNKNDNKSGVGNGGFSLRTRSVMIKIINKINVDNTIFNTNTLEYMANTNSFFPPEDVYFTKNMEDYNIGILADRQNAMKFSIESVNYDDSLGGHNFWFSDPNWIQRMYKYNICTFQPNFDLNMLEHRGGWGSILNKLINNHFFNKNAKFQFFDIIEKEFLWRNDYYCDTKWGGIFHCTPNTPPYLNEINIEYIFKNENFIKSLYHCVFIVSLSKTLTKYLFKKIKCELNLNIPIYTLYHPVDLENAPLFNMNKFFDNNNKMLIQIGQQLRKMTSIYLLNSLPCNKLWLTGTKKFERLQELMEKEINYLKIDKTLMNPNIIMHYTETFKEYDQLLSQNIVFVDLFDAAANNTVLECIIRNTPIIINKIDPVVDYLGEDYPLYFQSLEEVPDLINTQKITNAHIYLQNLDKTKFSIPFFITELMNIIKEHFLTYY